MGKSVYRRKRGSSPTPAPSTDTGSAREPLTDSTWPRDFPMGWTPETKVLPCMDEAVDLCSIPDQPFNSLGSDIGYEHKVVGRISRKAGAWRLVLYSHEIGTYKTYLGATKAAYLWFSGLDIIPWDADGKNEVAPRPPRRHR